MTNLRVLEPALSDSFESMFKRLMAPMQIEAGNGSLDMRVDVSEKDAKDSGGKVLRSERHYGAVSHAFAVAQDVDEAKAVARYENGVFTLELPKKATSESKRLTVQ